MDTPVEPKDAASLILLRDGTDGIEVLLGRRDSRSSAFPSVYVFPGGRVDAQDGAVGVASPLSPAVVELVGRSADPAFAHALAIAAVRETFEETGLLIGGDGDVGDVDGETWSRVRAMGLAPALDCLDYIGRATTPETRPIRFHARFFLTRVENAIGTLTGNGELHDLRWVLLSEARALPMLDVTEFMIGEIQRFVEEPLQTPRPERKPRWFTYVNGTSSIADD